MKESNSCVLATNVSVSFNSTKVLDNISLDCKYGEFVAIVGKSGVGKTSLLNVLAGLIPYRGSVNVSGKLGYVFQDHALFPWMTVENNIAFGITGLARADREDRITELLDRTDMTPLRDRYPAQLSGGQVQRVALARALGPSPDALLMDEPYAALDYYTREKMQSWLQDIWRQERKTVLFVTHNLEEAMFLADRILVMNAGRFNESIDVLGTRPRSVFDAEFAELKSTILKSLDR